jgi:pimeloyl-ACP methyl ester carboxylesterase
MVSLKVCGSQMPSIVMPGARRALGILCTNEHTTLAGPLLDPRQRPSLPPALYLRQHKFQSKGGMGAYMSGNRTHMHTDTKSDERYLPSFYLVSSWYDNSSHNKAPKPASLSDFKLDAPTCFVFHGVFGCGKNWHPFVKNHLCDKLPDWQFVLIDTRGHGESVNAVGPHTIKECAQDARRLAEALGRSPDVTIGHSLGGKCMLIPYMLMM